MSRRRVVISVKQDKELKGFYYATLWLDGRFVGTCPLLRESREEARKVGQEWFKGQINEQPAK